MCNEHNAPSRFEKIRRKHPDLNKIILELLSNRRTPKEAMRLANIKLLYVLITLKPFPEPMCDIQITEYILSIPNIVCFRNFRGDPHFYSMRK